MLENNRSKLILALMILLVIFGGYLLYRFLADRQVIEEAPVGQEFPESPLESKPLAQNKEEIRDRLTAPLGEAGTLTDGPDFRIDYIAPDFFQVEIKSINIVDARDRAISWFKDKGFSEEDICKLPVTFYLSVEVARKLEGSGVIFSTLPDFCR